MTFENQLRTTSDTLLRTLDRMHELEEQKRAIPSGGEEFLRLAREIDVLALQVLRQTERQESIAETTIERRKAGGGLGRPIAAIPPEPRALHVILSDWREAERRLAAARQGTPEEAEAASAVQRFRDEYRIAHEAVQKPG